MEKQNLKVSHILFMHKTALNQQLFEAIVMGCKNIRILY